MRVAFWGTPDFAAPSLRALIGEGFEVCAVVTQPDKPQGREREIQHSPIKRIALEENIPLFQPATARDDEMWEMFHLIQPDISVVVAYGHILPRKIIDLPKHGTINIHASLLPKLRGAAPIQAAIREGLSETGITIMRMVEELDAGPIILQSTTPISEDETYGELRDRLCELGALTLIEALALISIGEAHETPQDDGASTYASKITRDTVRVNWRESARNVANCIRAYDPEPGSFTTLNGKDVKLFGARTCTTEQQHEPGYVLRADQHFVVQAGDGGAVEIEQVHPAGKKRMLAREWISGRGIAQGDKFGT